MNKPLSYSTPCTVLSRRWLLVLCALATCSLGMAPTPALSQEAAQHLLSRSDAVRNPTFSYSTRVVLSEYKAGREQDTMVLRSYARPAQRKGEYQTLVSFLQPSRELGKHMLKNGNDLWFYDPAGNASIRLSPQQRLLGQAANADVVSTSLTADYAATIDGSEEITDGERQRRSATKLSLRASAPSAGYPRVEIWVDSTSAAPIRARFYSDSGALLKTIFYRKFRTELGASRPTEYVIINGVDPKSVTLMQFDEFRAVDIPAQWMQKDHMPLLKTE